MFPTEAVKPPGEVLPSRKGIESINQFKYWCVVFLTLELGSNPMFLFLQSKTADYLIMPFGELCYLVSNIQFSSITVCWATL